VKIRDFDDTCIERLNNQFETSTPESVLAWAWSTFDTRVAASSSFQTQSVALLHMISRVAPRMKVYFVDTGFHFPETLAFQHQLSRQLGLRVEVLKPKLDHHEFRARFGHLYCVNPDLCCRINKVEPLQAAIGPLEAWIAGIRRDQTPQRRHVPIISRRANGSLKICPMAMWAEHDVWDYIRRHGLPTHPLLEQGYWSIGCAPCTRAIQNGDDPRSGRWPGKPKVECGLHSTNAVAPAKQHSSKE
jgi:phosphoadenosine phosphosulfate reductase